MLTTRSKPTLTRLVPQQLALLLLAPLLLWPALVNGGAFFFPDTTAYVRSIDALAVRVLHQPSEWTSERTIYVAQANAAAPLKVGAGATQENAKPVISGRSPYYGALAYLGVLFGSFWVVIAVQALAATMVVIGIMRHAVTPARQGTFAIAVAAAMAVAMLTPMPFYASMLMPDIFAGLAIIAVAVLLCGWQRETTAGRIGWMALATVGALSHSATILILAGMLAGAAVLWLVWRSVAPSGAAIGMVMAVIVLGVAGETICSQVVERMTGHPPIRPPFITARLTADRVGTDYLRRHCDTERWVLCRFRDRLPLHSDSFLWSSNPATGVFMTIPLAEARELSGEQMRFALAVLRDNPVDVIRSSSAAILDQLTQVGLDEFHYTPETISDFTRAMPAEVAGSLRDTSAYRNTMPIDLITMLAWPMLFAGILTIGWAYRRPELASLARLGSWVLFGWVVNIVVCGALSTPHQRYNMRALWVLPIAATVIVVAAMVRRRHAGVAEFHERSTSAAA